MVYEKKVSQITLKDIIEQQIKFSEDNDIFKGMEYTNINKGEVSIYKQMLDDIEILQVETFVNKYLETLKDITLKLDNHLVKDNNEIEMLSGVNNAIVNVLKLINPIYEYRMD